MEDGAETRAKTRYHTEPKGKASNSDGALQAISLIQPDELQPSRMVTRQWPRNSDKGLLHSGDRFSGLPCQRARGDRRRQGEREPAAAGTAAKDAAARRGQRQAGQTPPPLPGRRYDEDSNERTRPHHLSRAGATTRTATSGQNGRQEVSHFGISLSPGAAGCRHRVRIPDHHHQHATHAIQPLDTQNPTDRPPRTADR